MMGTETKYAAAVSVDDGLYKVVVASESVKPYIDDRWLAGIDPEDDDGCWPYRLAIPEGTPEGSVVLIKGRPDGGEKEIYRLFQVEVKALIEVERPLIGGWTFDQSDGNLVTDFVHGFLKVAPTDWGYCRIISELWSAETYIENALKHLGLGVPPGGIDWSAANYWKNLLSDCIKARQRAEKAKDALRMVAGKLLSHDLLDDEVGSKYHQKGHLRSLANAPEPTKHCAAGVIRDLCESYEFCREALPELPELPPNTLKA